jgi:hypothetical protein
MMETNDSLLPDRNAEPVWPFDLIVDGIYYKHIRGTNQVTVTSSDNNRFEYRGDFNIPRKVTYREREYQVTGIGEYAFSYSAIFFIEIPDCITGIGEDAFHSCSGLATISIPESVKSIGNRAFFGCNGLKSIVLPKSVTTVGIAPFYNCSRLESIVVAVENPAYMDIDGVLFTKDKTTLLAYPPGKKGSYAIPEGVTTIASHAFKSCIYLTSIIIPKNVSIIGRSAFEDCESLAEIRIDAPVPPTCGKEAFDHIFKTSKLIMPEGSEKAYREAAEWKNFFN